MLLRILSFLFVLAFTTACCKQQDLALSPTLASWAPYSGQQEVTFVNAAGQRLVFITEESSLIQEGTDKVCGTYGIETRRIHFKAKDDPGFQVMVTLSHEVLVRVQVYHQDPAGGNLNIQFNTISEQYVTDAWRDRYYSTITLNGKTYRQVLNAFGIPNAGPLSFSEIFYGKEAGLIGFRNFAGELYFAE